MSLIWQSKLKLWQVDKKQLVHYLQSKFGTIRQNGYGLAPRSKLCRFIFLSFDPIEVFNLLQLLHQEQFGENGSQLFRKTFKSLMK